MAPVAQSGFSTKQWLPESAEAPILFERYRILGIIGEGGMGTVFKGYHLNLKRDVAIKTLRIDHRHSSDMVSRFLKEMESVGQMDHPNVVRATDAGEKNGVFYLVMEYLPGSDLSRLASRRSKLDIATACALARQAALGLEYIHQTLIHRDIKPSNLLLTTTGLVKILDLGLARLSIGAPIDREHTPVGVAVGTYTYMAPEQADGAADIDGRADIYSLGCTLFKLVTGHAPYSGPDYDSAAKVLYAHRHVPLTSVALFESIPQPLREVVQKMMAKNPDDRFQSAKEVAAALTPFIPGSDSELPEWQGPANETEETPVKPLPWPLPAELSRLTDYHNEKPVDTPSMTSTIIASPAARRTWIRWLIGTCLLACALTPAVWFTAVAPIRWRAEEPPAPPVSAIGRPLDQLSMHTSHRLLDQELLPIGYTARDSLKWRWDKPSLTLDAKGPSLLLFPLGTTSRLSYRLEVGITQAPWTGNVGVFWGYHEDANTKSSRAPGQTFAKFQMLLLEHRRNPQEGDVDSVRRGRGELKYDLNGELIMDQYFSNKHDVGQLLGTEKILVISIRNQQLHSARFAGIPLDNLCGFRGNQSHLNDRYDGPVGLITHRHNVVFSDVRFISP